MTSSRVICDRIVSKVLQKCEVTRQLTIPIGMSSSSGALRARVLLSSSSTSPLSAFSALSLRLFKLLASDELTERDAFRLNMALNRCLEPPSSSEPLLSERAAVSDEMVETGTMGDPGADPEDPRE